MKRFFLILLSAMLLLSTCAFADTEIPKFDSSVLADHDGYSYDKFEKTWEYYGAYHKKYTNATVVIGITTYGDANSVSHVEIYAWIRDQYNKEIYSDVSQLMILADDQLITCAMYAGDTSSFTAIDSSTNEVLRLIGEAEELSFKLTYKTGSLTLEPSAEDVAELVAAAKTMYDNNLVAYTTELDVVELLTTLYPITIE